MASSTAVPADVAESLLDSGGRSSLAHGISLAVGASAATASAGVIANAPATTSA
jgi:thiamine pyrophosphate-dependent acetolactate synthase large subunit-like protein